MKWSRLRRVNRDRGGCASKHTQTHTDKEKVDKPVYVSGKWAKVL